MNKLISDLILCARKILVCFKNFPVGKFATSCLCAMIIAVAFWRSEALAEVLYDPSSGSYFELFTDPKAFQGGNWLSAREFAQRRSHKGIPGRLAVIKTRQTHEFIRSNFRFKFPAWIGLRYICSNGSLLWVTGERLNRNSDFQAWHDQWRRAGAARTGCRSGGSAEFMPVYYTDSASPRWQAAGPKKGYEWFLVEYPSR